MKKIAYLTAFLLTFIFLNFQTQAQVIINEYSASNLHSFFDNYGKTEDWIELYNPSDVAVNIGGWYLSDKTSKPTKWAIPNETMIPAKGFLVFWCSGRDEGRDTAFHTNFKLSQTAGKDRIVLADASENIVNDIEMQTTLVEHSHCRSKDGSDDWQFCTTPSLGLSNDDQPTYKSYTKAPKIDLAAGFYDGEQTVTIQNNEANSVLRYTLNGLNPTLISPIYSDPIKISATTVVKAQSFSNDTTILTGKMDFNTYFIDEEFTLAVFSVGADDVIELANGDGDLIPIGSIEYFDIDKNRKAASFGSLNRHGQDSWELEHRSLDWISRDEMGYSKAVEAKLFSYSDRDEYQKFMFRNSGDDNYPAITQEEGITNADHQGSAHIRDEYVQTLALEGDMELDTRAVERVILFLNGKYWGLYGLRERPVDHDYTKEYYKQGKYDLQFLSTWGETKAQYGGTEAFDAWYQLRDFVLDNDMSNSDNYKKVEDELNMISFIDYFVANQNVVAQDWLNYNTGWWRGTNKKGKHKKWGYLLWDMDATFDFYINYTGVPDVSPAAKPCDINEISLAMDDFFDGEGFLLPENLSDCVTIKNGSCPYTSDDSIFIKVVKSMTYCCTDEWAFDCQNLYDIYKNKDSATVCTTIQNGSCPYTMDDDVFLQVIGFDEACCSEYWDGTCEDFYQYLKKFESGDFVYGNVGKHEKLFIKLQEESPEFRTLYYQRQADLMNTVYSCDNMNNTLDRMLAVIEPEMPRQIERWGGTLSGWKSNVNKMKKFINKRCDLLDDGIISCFDELSGPFDIRLEIKPEGVGKMKFNTLKIDQFPWNGTYFGGVHNDIEAKVIDNNYKFSHWETSNGNVITPNLMSDKIQLQLTNTETLTAVFDKISAVDNINNELNMDVYPNPATQEFIVEYTLQNSSNVQISLHTLLGQKISLDLPRQHKSSGTHKSLIQIDRNNLETGIYFIKLTTDEFEITKKITIL